MKKGFTLVEIIIVTTIIIFLSALTLANYKAGGQQFALQRSAHRLAQDLRRAEEMTMSAKEFEGSIPSGGYGIYFDINESKHYILFADLSVPPNYLYDSGSDGKVEDIQLEAEIKISGLFPSSPLNLCFSAPIPTIHINPDSWQGSIILENEEGQTKTVFLNKAGLIDID